MVSETQTATTTRTVSDNWLGAAVAGLLATFAFGGFQTVMGSSSVIAHALPALYGVQGPALAVGWGIHLVHGALLGIAYAAFATPKPLREYAENIPTGALLGIVFSVLLTIVAVGFIMPLWLQAVGFPMAPPIPNLAPSSFIGHAVYGVVLGALYPVLAAKF
ncbi:histidine kinase [Haladaptatus sp. DJG-WS-42]|uniref:histidine kinase n=1 Tax=Haladaptatus sp. DJG-WS-42 TaxID=3120516 RepID=UPI0030CB5D77